MKQIITRTEARELGLKRFFLGTMCKNYHVAERTVSNGSCYECQKEMSRQYNHNNKEKVRANVDRWIEENPEARAKIIKRRTQKLAKMRRQK